MSLYFTSKNYQVKDRPLSQEEAYNWWIHLMGIKFHDICIYIYEKKNLDINKYYEIKFLCGES
jgi:hypothetical protein